MSTYKQSVYLIHSTFLDFTPFDILYNQYNSLLIPYSFIHSKRNSVIATNSNFHCNLMAYFFDISNLDYLILQNLQFEISEVYDIRLSRYKDQRIRLSFVAGYISLVVHQYISLIVVVFFRQKGRTFILELNQFVERIWSRRELELNYQDTRIQSIQPMR